VRAATEGPHVPSRGPQVVRPPAVPLLTLPRDYTSTVGRTCEPTRSSHTAAQVSPAVAKLVRNMQSRQSARAHQGEKSSGRDSEHRRNRREAFGGALRGFF